MMVIWLAEQEQPSAPRLLALDCGPGGCETHSVGVVAAAVGDVSPADHQFLIFQIWRALTYYTYEECDRNFWPRLHGREFFRRVRGAGLSSSKVGVYERERGRYLYLLDGETVYGTMNAS